MKIVQSYWSHPSHFKDERKFGRTKGGFLDELFHYMGWALSCLTLKKFYKKIELVTDKEGEALFINQFNLPYSSVSVCLDELNGYHPELWAIGKIKAYQIQTEPFLHVDGDIFIWKKFGDKAFHKKPLIVQNIDLDYAWYKEMMKAIETHFEFVPTEIYEAYKIRKDFTAINAGIIGGADLGFFQEYTNKAFEFVDKNVECLKSVNIGLFNNVFEQYLFYCLAKAENKNIEPLFNLKPHSEFTELMNFNLVPNFCSYIHLMGFAKKNIFACEQIEMRLKYEFPKYYAHFIKLFPKPFFNSPENRFEKLKKAYQFLRCSDSEAILKQKFCLSAGVKIIEGENETKTLEYTNPQWNKKETIVLEGWDLMLPAFSEPSCGYDIIDSVSEGHSKKEIEELKSKVIEFLMSKLIYKDILKFSK